MSMPTMPTGDGKFRDEVIRVAELTVNTSILDGIEFVNCRIIGPAVFVLLHDITIVGCRWDAPDANAIFWEIPPSRPHVVGAVGVQNCIFSSCAFEGIGLAGPADARATLEAGLNQPE